MLRWMSVAVLSAALWVGCQREPAAPEAAPESAPPPPSPALRDLKRDLTVELKSTQVTVMNLDSYQRADDRFARQEAELVLFDRLPWEDQHTDAALAAQLAASAKPAGVTIDEVIVTRRPAPPRTLPAQTTEAFEWAAEDLLVTWDVRFRIDALTRNRVLQWWRGLPEHLPRLLMIRTMTEVPGGWTVAGEVYGLRRVTVPRHVATVPSWEQRLAARSIEPEGLSDTDRALLDEGRALDAAIREALPAVERSLEVLARTHMRDARWRMFTGKIAQVEGLDLAKLMAR